MPMTEICTIVKDKGKTAVIEIVRMPKCDGCNACAFNKRDRIRVPAIKDIACGEGDLVTVAMPEAKITLAPLFLFVIPLLLTLAAVLISRGWPDWGQALIIAGFLASGLVILYLVDKLYRRKRKFMPVIIERAEKGEQDDRSQID